MCILTCIDIVSCAYQRFILSVSYPYPHSIGFFFLVSCAYQSCIRAAPELYRSCIAPYLEKLCEWSQLAPSLPPCPPPPASHFGTTQWGFRYYSVSVAYRRVSYAYRAVSKTPRVSDPYRDLYPKTHITKCPKLCIGRRPDTWGGMWVFRYNADTGPIRRYRIGRFRYARYAPDTCIGRIGRIEVSSVVSDAYRAVSKTPDTVSAYRGVSGPKCPDTHPISPIQST